ncbi:endonuclease I family protein [Streptomyces rapamycinicus]|uniref:Ribonuclease n=2 Tax=Streptomyces rapamycinicus TaxID=1226757 RepID=A0A0A0NTS3_STRRN|nr:endonuclease [Streptomyces rapamycinicus]AGP60911.1 ribonuclease [Streptomyces rapamycinicus NRRL 5491]MBB4787915.1 endonuclease I [Streptomyces rapamycinicus]RLV72254.1 ribonuclease [Streptomyces rapamycinicus NRRL 5491]UTP36445.1 endonuclease [Streptomyces rapamycinicus NRRL 5491]
MSTHRARRSRRLPLLAVVAAAGVAAPSVAVANTPAPADTTRPAAVQAPDDYYQDATGKSGPELKAALHTIISEQTKLSYDEVWDALKSTDEDPDNPSNVILLYSGHSQAKDANGGDPDDWNREHVWAKSHGDFGTSTGPGTDLHHLRPANVKVNSIRGNKDFDNGGEEVPDAAGNRTDDDSFEPRDQVKGDIARMILYMAVRYDGDDGFPDLEPNDKVDNGSAPNIGRLSVLKEWSAEDPPDDFEKNRNEVIYDSFQHNRNPFIDHPEWVDSIWK